MAAAELYRIKHAVPSAASGRRRAAEEYIAYILAAGTTSMQERQAARAEETFLDRQRADLLVENRRIEAENHKARLWG